MSQGVIGLIVFVIGVILVVLYFDRDMFDDMNIYNIGMYVGPPLLIVIGLIMILKSIFM